MLVWCHRTFLAAHGVASGGASTCAATADPLVEDLVAGNRILAMEGVLDAMGHISVRSTAKPDRFLLARSMAPELVMAADILEHDLDGQAINAGDRPSISSVHPAAKSIVRGRMYAPSCTATPRR